MADKIKFALALVFLIAGIAGFYVFAEQAMVLRILLVLGGVAAAVAVAWYTVPGQQFFEFGRETRSEVKKVVWPSRKETLQTTAAVFAFVVVMAIFLWLTDKSLEWVLYDLVLGWK